MNIIQLLNSRDFIFLPHEGVLYAVNYISVELICTDFACICGHEVVDIMNVLFCFIINYMISII